MADVPGAKPAVLRKDLARRLFVLEVAGEDRVGLDQHFAVVRNPQLDAGQGRPDAAEAVARGTVDRRTGRALGEPVALEDDHVERREEFDDLLRERGAAR